MMPMLKRWMRSFSDEVEKIAAAPQALVGAAHKAEQHLTAKKKDWEIFEKALKIKNFQDVILAHPQADAKLKKYVRTFGAYIRSKDVVAEYQSKSGKTYVIKDLHTGRLGCGCGDWQYKHSIHGGDCKHIKGLAKTNLVREPA